MTEAGRPSHSDRRYLREPDQGGGLLLLLPAGVPRGVFDQAPAPCPLSISRKRRFNSIQFMISIRLMKADSPTIIQFNSIHFVIRFLKADSATRRRIPSARPCTRSSARPSPSTVPAAGSSSAPAGAVRGVGGGDSPDFGRCDLGSIDTESCDQTVICRIVRDLQD